MSLLTRSHRLILAIVVAGTAACASDDVATPTSSSKTSELDVIGLAERPASLLVLAPSTTPAQRRRLEQTLTRLGGGVLESLPPRLVIAQVPSGADTALTALGVVARFDRAVTAADLTAPTLPEERFLSVHAARWFPSDVPPTRRLAPTMVPRPQAEVESAPQRMPVIALKAPGDGGGETPPPVIDPDDTVSVPYASGNVVVSIVLPESNGSIDPSTEDWNEQLIRETYLKVQAALDKAASAEPNADVHYIVHYESAPAAGGLLGTVDTGYEVGQRAQYGSMTEFLATADVLAHLVGHPVAEGDVWTAALEYDAKLKHQYDADAAFFVIVAPNGNGTAYLRAHAWLNGPWTVLDSSYGWETFMHEFGHIYGAQDEYCPDACVPPSAITGYLGMYNANAFSNEGGGGIDNGHGESVNSLMQYNDPTSINGYTRGAWGWLDTDGDGIVEVRDTVPKSDLTAIATGQQLRVTGQIVDHPESRLAGSVPYSANRIVGLDYAFDAAGPWFRLPLAGDTRGRQAVDVQITGVRADTRTVYLRGVNSVGNLEPRPLAIVIAPTGTTNTAPHLRLDVPARAGSGGPVTVTTTVKDLDNDTVQVRYDLDGNGTWDTSYRAPGAYTFNPGAGLIAIRAEARDARGATRAVTAELPVVRGAAAPTLTVANLPGLVHGLAAANVTMTATATTAAGSPAALNVVTELVTSDEQYRKESAADTSGRIAVTLPTPPSLRTRSLDLTAGDPSLGVGWARDLLVLDPQTVVVAGGTTGLWILDITDRAAPRVVSKLALETSANQLFKTGNLIYVLGTYLTVVDICDRANPREVKQVHTVNDQVIAENTDPVDIPDGQWPNSQFFNIDRGAKITSTQVTVTIDHPNPADLTISLVATKDSRIAPIVLADHVAAPGGLRTMTFTSRTTPALRGLEGMFAEGFWTIQVLDDQANGQVGRLVSSKLQFGTSARAEKVIDGAGAIAGVTTSGDLVIAGNGVETLDVSVPFNIRSYGRLTGTGVRHASMLGDTAILSLGLHAKDAADAGLPLRGLCAVDLRSPRSPRIVRCETTMGWPVEHAVVGSRLYVHSSPDCNKELRDCSGLLPSTVIGDASRFARGLSWQRGTSPLFVDRGAVGDDQQLWTVAQGFVQQLDVANPALVSVRTSYPRSSTQRLIPLRMPEVMMFDFSTLAHTTVLGDTQNILSRLYRITVEARDAAGQVTRASRTVHVVPYDHAPTAATAEFVPYQPTGEAAHVHVTAVDPDGATTWDPVHMARLDWDGDGSFDTDWYWMGGDKTGATAVDFALTVAPGTYNAVVEVRDGFWARFRQPVTIVVPGR